MPTKKPPKHPADRRHLLRKGWEPGTDKGTVWPNGVPARLRRLVGTAWVHQADIAPGRKVGDHRGRGRAHKSARAGEQRVEGANEIAPA
jgi:hypothetical protein